MQTRSKRPRFDRNVFGAADRNNIELSKLSKVFEELENWEAHLRSEPAVTHKLLALDVGGQSSAIERRTNPASHSPERGPTL